MAASVWQTSVWLASCQVNLIFCSSALKVYSSTSEHSIGRERERATMALVEIDVVADLGASKRDKRIKFFCCQLTG